jgi:hypothetical protein
VIWLAGCADEREEILHPRAPTLNLTERGFSPRFDQFVFSISNSEPLPYPILLHITMRAAVFAAGKLVGVLHEIDTALKRGSRAWYGFYALGGIAFHPARCRFVGLRTSTIPRCARAWRS